MIPSAPDAVIPSAPEAVIPLGRKARTLSAPLAVMPEVFEKTTPSAPDAVIPFEPMIVSPPNAGTELTIRTRVSASVRRMFLKKVCSIKHKPRPQSS